VVLRKQVALHGEGMWHLVDKTMGHHGGLAHQEGRGLHENLLLLVERSELVLLSEVLYLGLVVLFFLVEAAVQELPLLSCQIDFLEVEAVFVFVTTTMAGAVLVAVILLLDALQLPRNLYLRVLR
jgi:hypothetical protein